MSDPLPDAALDRVFRDARTFNHYLDKPVSETLLRAVWELMKWGPTSANQEPARIVWCTSDAAKEKLAACASDTNGAKIRKAPATAIVAMDLAFPEQLPRLYPHADARSWFAGKPDLVLESAARNSTLQGAYLIVAARMLGLDVGPMSGFDAKKVDEAFFPDSSLRTNFIATLGYGDRETLHERLPRLAFEDANRFA